MKTRFLAMMFSCILIAMSQVTYGGGRTCSDNGGNSPYVCVEWNQGTNPLPNFDFEFGFSDAANPDVQFKVGDSNWRVWSQKTDTDTTPDNLGDLTIDADVLTHDFPIRIANGTTLGAGAVNVASMNLKDPNANWTGFSSVSGSTAGALAGDLVVVRDSAGNGGTCNLTIGGDVPNDISVPIVEYLDIQGNVSGSIAVEEVAFDGSLNVRGNLTGPIEVKVALRGRSQFRVWGDVGVRGSVEIASFDSDLSNILFVLFGETPGALFAGDLVLPGGIPAGTSVRFLRRTTATASIDFRGSDVDLGGWMALHRGGGGAIVDVGVLNGEIWLADFNSAFGFTGSLTLDSIGGSIGGSSNGIIYEGAAAGFSGTIHILGDHDGQILSDSFILSVGSIDIDGDIGPSGEIFVDFDVDGTINVDGNLDGQIFLNNNFDGQIRVGGNVTQFNGRIVIQNQIMNGDIVVEGLHDGFMSLPFGTGVLSLIHLQGGLGANGVVTFVLDVNGDILVGPASVGIPPLPSITYDGCVEITTGDLNGDVTVVGCHATTAYLGLEIAGATSGTTSITQTGCANTVAFGACP